MLLLVSLPGWLVAATTAGPRQVAVEKVLPLKSFLAETWAGCGDFPESIDLTILMKHCVRNGASLTCTVACCGDSHSSQHLISGRGTRSMMPRAFSLTLLGTAVMEPAPRLQATSSSILATLQCGSLEASRIQKILNSFLNCWQCLDWWAGPHTKQMSYCWASVEKG